MDLDGVAREGHLPRRWFLRAVGVLGVGTLMLPSCVKYIQETTGPDPKNPDTAIYKHLVFRVSCAVPLQEIFGVGVYDESDQNRVVLGSTLPDGRFPSLRKLDASKSYRVELYSYPNHECIIWARGISWATTPSWWKDDEDKDNPENTLGLGLLCGDQRAQGCWGY